MQFDLFAVEGDGALVGPLHPVEDLHQGRLARAVLADEGVHGAAADRDVDVVVGDDAGEPLGDSAEFYGEGVFLAGGWLARGGAGGFDGDSRGWGGGGPAGSGRPRPRGRARRKQRLRGFLQARCNGLTACVRVSPRRWTSP
ncbi:hypothetical protein GCM10023324_46930 [Streptomyces youssoufiensis]